MTTQVKIYIEVSDIIGLRLQCKTCGCSLILETEKDSGTVNNLLAANNTLLQKCPTCHAPWTQALNPQTIADSDIKDLFRKIRDLKKSEQGFGCSVTLEIKEPESE